MVKIATVKNDVVKDFFYKYGKKPQDFILEAHTKLIKMGNVKKLTPEQLINRNQIEATIREAHEALATSNKIRLGIK